MNIFSQYQNRYQGNPRDIFSFPTKFYASDFAVQTLSHVGDLQEHTGCVNAINFNSSGDFVITGSDDTTVKIWNTWTKKCIKTLHGHCSNVFATSFLDHKSDREVVSGSNDSEIRHYNLDTGKNTAYAHHTKKVLGICTNPCYPDTFISCSSDGTARLFDIRKSYENTRIEDSSKRQTDYSVVPQALGGGSRRSGNSNISQSLLVDYKGSVENSRSTLYSVDISPNGNHFILSSGDGNVRLFDLRYIKNHSPDDCVNIYRNFNVKIKNNCEATGCKFSNNGKEIVVSLLSEHIYVFDVDKDFSKEFELDFTTDKKKIDKKIEKIPIEKSSNLNENEIQLSSIVSNITENNFYQQDETDEDEEEEIDEMDDYDSKDQDEYLTIEDLLELREDLDTETESESEVETFDAQTFKNIYKGHYSRETIKGVGFFGPNSEYIISGSDSGTIFLWDKKSTKLVRILEGHENNVNTVACHPHCPVLASSGIDSFVSMWSPNGSYPNQKKIKEREDRINEILEENSSKPFGRDEQMNNSDLYYLLNLYRQIINRQDTREQEE
eukprot:gene6189-10196_t